jgi:hypothetical protein
MTSARSSRPPLRLLVSDDPRVVAAREGGDVAGTGDQLGAIVHSIRQLPTDVVLEVRRLAAVGAVEEDQLEVGPGGGDPSNQGLGEQVI